MLLHLKYWPLYCLSIPNANQPITVIWHDSTAIIPCLAYAFAVTLGTKADLIIWETMIGIVIKHNLKLWKSTPTALIREGSVNLGLGTPSIRIKYYRCLATAPTSSQEPSIRHCTITLNLFTKRMVHVLSLTKELLT